MQADDLGKRPEYQEPQSFFERYRKIAAEIIEKEECFSLKNLAVNGTDLIDIQVPPGPEMGKILSVLLEKVIEEELPNDKNSLLDFAKTFFQSQNGTM